MHFSKIVLTKYTHKKPAQKMLIWDNTTFIHILLSSQVSFTLNNIVTFSLICLFIFFKHATLVKIIQTLTNHSFTLSIMWTTANITQTLHYIKCISVSIHPSRFSITSLS